VTGDEGADELVTHADTFGGTGRLTHPRGPYAGGAPEHARRVDPPRLDRFGLHEIRRMLLIGLVMLALVVRGLALKAVGARRESWAGGAAHGLVDAFEVLGPTFVKLGQMIASSPGVFPAPLANACLRCLDEVKPFDGGTACRLIEEALGHPPAVLFRSFEERPLSAASIAQVHACTLPDGRDAVLKLQRPDIAHRMNTDLRIMYLFARVVMRFEAGDRLNPKAVIEDLHQVTNEELNFALEAHRQACFRQNIGAFGDNAGITAPEVYWDYCGPTVICMERMTGVPLDEFDDLRERGIDGELVLRRGVKVWMEAAMVHGPFHGDVHAGNLWLLDDGRASYLDFGIMGELDDDWKQILRDLQYTAMIDGDYSRVVRNWKRVGVLPADIGDDEQVGLMIKAVVDPLLDQTLGEVSLGEIMKQNLEMSQQFGAKTPRELVLITKQLLYFERYAKELAPSYTMSRDLFLLKNVFPDDVARVAAERGVELPE
jgi:predicted unusual protein kinase regulating ubiquinone biosynthesis (AarF/ABC1/UbiB family)